MAGEPAHTKRVVIKLDPSLLVDSSSSSVEGSESFCLAEAFAHVRNTAQALSSLLPSLGGSADVDVDSALDYPEDDKQLNGCILTDMQVLGVPALREYFTKLGVLDQKKQNFIFFCLRQREGDGSVLENSAQFQYALGQSAMQLSMFLLEKLPPSSAGLKVLPRLDPDSLFLRCQGFSEGVVRFEYRQNLSFQSTTDDAQNFHFAQIVMQFQIDITNFNITFNRACIELAEKSVSFKDAQGKKHNVNVAVCQKLRELGFIPDEGEDEERYIIQTEEAARAKAEIAKLQWQAFRIRCQNGGKAEADRLDSICDAAHQALTVLPSFWTPEGQKPEEILQVAISTVVEHGESFDYINISPKIKIPRALPEGNVALQLEKPGFVKILNDSAYIPTSLGSRARVSGPPHEDSG